MSAGLIAPIDSKELPRREHDLGSGDILASHCDCIACSHVPLDPTQFRTVNPHKAFESRRSSQFGKLLIREELASILFRTIDRGGGAPQDRLPPSGASSKIFDN